MDARPSYPFAIADRASNISQDNSTNRPLPWVALACLIAGISFGCTMSMYVEFREMKTRVMLLDDSNQRLKLYLEAHGFVPRGTQENEHERR